MAEKNYKVDEVIKIVYQAPNKETGLTITAEIVLPGGAKDIGSFPDLTLVDVLSKGIYTGDFTPDAQGEWQAIVHKPGDEGQVVKRYSVGAHNIHDIGEDVGIVDVKVDTAIAGVNTVDGKVDTVDGKVVGVQNTADSIETKVDNLTNITGALDTPPMIS